MHNPFVRFLIERDLISPAVAKQLSEKHRFVREPIGMIAAGHGLLHPNQIDEILDQQRQTNKLFGELAVEMGFLDRKQVQTLLKIQELRSATEVAEGLALAGLFSIEDMAGYLGAFLLRDREVLEMLTND